LLITNAFERQPPRHNRRNLQEVHGSLILSSRARASEKGGSLIISARVLLDRFATDGISGHRATPRSTFMAAPAKKIPHE